MTIAEKLQLIKETEERNHKRVEDWKAEKESRVTANTEQHKE